MIDDVEDRLRHPMGEVKMQQALSRNPGLWDLQAIETEDFVICTGPISNWSAAELALIPNFKIVIGDVERALSANHILLTHKRHILEAKNIFKICCFV